MFPHFSTIVRQFCLWQISGSDTIKSPMNPTTPTYIELPSTPTVPAVYIEFDISIALVGLLLAILLLSTTFAVSVVASTIIQRASAMASQGAVGWIGKATRAEAALGQEQQAHNDRKTKYHRLMTEHLNLKNDHDEAKEAAEKRANEDLETIRMKNEEIASLQKSLKNEEIASGQESSKNESSIIRPMKSRLRAIMAAERAKDPDNLLIRYKTAIKDLEDCRSSLSECSTKLGRCQEENTKLHRRIWSLQGENHSAAEKIKQLTEDCNKKYEEGYKSNEAYTQRVWSDMDFAREAYIKTLAALKKEQSKTCDLTKQLDRSKAKVVSLMEESRDPGKYRREADKEIATLRKANAEAEGKIKRLEAQIPHLKTRRKWDDMESKLEEVEAKFSSEDKAYQTLRKDYDVLQAQHAASVKEVARLKGEAFKALNEGSEQQNDEIKRLKGENDALRKDVCVVHDDTAALAKEKGLRDDAEKRRDDAERELKALREHANKVLTSRLAQQNTIYLDSLRQKEEACKLIIHDKQQEWAAVFQKREAEYKQILNHKEQECTNILREREAKYNSSIQEQERALKEAFEQKEKAFGVALNKKDHTLAKFVEAEKIARTKETKAAEALRNLHKLIVSTLANIQKLSETTDGDCDETMETETAETMNIDGKESLSAEQGLEQLYHLFKERNDIINARDEEITSLNARKKNLKSRRKQLEADGTNLLERLEEANDLQMQPDADETNLLKKLKEANDLVEKYIDISEALIHGVDKLAGVLGSSVKGTSLDDRMGSAQEILESVSDLLDVADNEVNNANTANPNNAEMQKRRDLRVAVSALLADIYSL